LFAAGYVDFSDPDGFTLFDYTAKYGSDEKL
jgi:hypothetical protein